MKRTLSAFCFLLSAFCAILLLFAITGCSTPSDSSASSDSSSDYKTLLDEGVDLLLAEDIDGGIAKIRAAYEADKNDETKMYYALAEIAAISVDDNVTKILTENFGFVNYPGKMNSLMSGDWMTEYVDNRYWYEEYTKQAPELNVPDWFANTSLYEDTLRDSSVQTTETFTFLLLVNLLDCNLDGFNLLVDKILTVFDDKFTTAAQLVDSMSDAGVVIPAKVIAACNLEEELGDTEVKVGKAELNMLIAAMEMERGIWQFISSYDMSVNLRDLKVLLQEPELTEVALLAAIKAGLTDKTFISRNPDAIDESKASFLDANRRLMASYTYLTGRGSTYPDAAKDVLRKYGQIWYDGVSKLSSAIENGSVFYIPESNPFDGDIALWPDSPANAAFGIDMGEVFTAGKLSSIFKRGTDGAIALYYMLSNGNDVMITDETLASYPDDCIGVGVRVNLALIKTLFLGVINGELEDDFMFMPLI